MNLSMHMLPMHSRLEALRAAICDYYLSTDRTMPEAIILMLPCVEDAIEDGECSYVELMYALFSKAVEEYVLWR